jgi:hypothetical protein
MEGDGARPGLLNKETRNAGEKSVHGFMGFLLNPKAAMLVLVYCLAASISVYAPVHFDEASRFDTTGRVHPPCSRPSRQVSG